VRLGVKDGVAETEGVWEGVNEGVALTLGVEEAEGVNDAVKDGVFDPPAAGRTTTVYAIHTLALDNVTLLGSSEAEV
jgi:hypothetical protein